jgi:hypothetical protein
MEYRGDTEREAKVRADFRRTMRAFSDEALAFQDTIIRGGIAREECDREIARRLTFLWAQKGRR